MKKNVKYVLFFWAIIAIIIGAPATMIWLVVDGYFGPMPSFEELENPRSNLASEVYSADHKILGKYYIENRSNVRYREISQNVINALVATEDIRYEKHSGIDEKGLLRVFLKTIILQQSTGGGSTITQQLAKNLFPRKSFATLWNKVITKFKEWVTAVKLERNYTKKEMVTMYMNVVPFGSNAFGIKSAARTFFDTSPDSLRIEEAATLIGLLKAPTYYSPVSNPQNSIQRRNVVLLQLKKYDFINNVEYDSLKSLSLVLKYIPQDHTEGPAPYMRENLRMELAAWCSATKKPDGTHYNLYKDGLKIYTTIDSRMQRYAEEAIHEHISKELQPQFFQHWKGKKNAPFDYRLSREEIDDIMRLAMHRTDRYRILAGRECGNCGRGVDFLELITNDDQRYYQCNADDCGFRNQAVPADSIEIIFKSPVPMKVFSWKGEIDTIMSPWDSLLYYKYYLQSGFMAMDPHSGHIKAWVGGINYKHFQYDHVKTGRRQVGSTFKPFVYTLAMQEKWSPCLEIPNVPVVFKDALGKEWIPENSDDEFNGLMLPLKFGLANSINTMTAYVMKQFGPDAVIALARKMGITSPLDPYPALALGVSDISVYELVSAYCCFANKGFWTEPLLITRIEDNKGTILKEFVPQSNEAMSEETATLMLSMLKGVVDGVRSNAAKKTIGTGVRLRFKYGLRNPIAGKTGTTQNYSDGWFVGIVPNLVAGLWVGCEDRSVHFRSITYGQGASMALPAWAYFMKKIYADGHLGVSEEDFFETIPANRLGVETDCEKYRQTQGRDYDEMKRYE